jgi:hypothetical protein
MNRPTERAKRRTTSSPAMRKFLGLDEPTRNTAAENLIYLDHEGREIGPQRKLSVEEMKAHSRAMMAEERKRDPEGWARIDAQKQRARGLEVKSLLSDLIFTTDAITAGEIDPDEGSVQVLDLAMQLKRLDPQTYAEYHAQVNAQDAARREAEYADHVEIYGEDDDVAEEIFNRELLGDQFNRAVEQAETAVQIADVSARLAGAEARNAAAYTDGVRELVDTNDQASLDRYQWTKAWIAEAGHDVDALIRDGDGAKAAQLVRTAYAQQDALDKEALHDRAARRSARRRQPMSPQG